MEMRLRRRHRRLIFSLNAKKQPRRLGASTSLSALRAALSWIYCKKSLILFDLTGFRSLRSAFASI